MENAWIQRRYYAEIHDAITAQDFSTHIFEINGLGGAGKTVFLRQIGAALGSPDGIEPLPPWSGIIDLYHSDLNNNSGLESRLVEVFGSGGEFAKFNDERINFSGMRQSGMPVKDIEVARAKLSTLFAQAINRVAARYRPVIAFDTTERIEYEVDDVQAACHIENESTIVRTWLVDQLTNWQNCVVLLVGRPAASRILTPMLEKALSGKQRFYLHAYDLGGFDEDEAEQYFTKWRDDDRIRDSAVLTPEFYARLHKATAGNPVRLEIAYVIARDGFGFDDLITAVMAEDAAPIGAVLDKPLIEIFMQHQNRPDPWRRALRYLAVARKGLTAELLAFLDGSDDVPAAQALLEQLAALPLVKWRPHDNSFYLHDELYDLCDRELLAAPEVQRLSQRIVEWYDRELQQLDASAPIVDDLLVNSLLYRLRADLHGGYDWYLRTGDSAIRSAETGLDMRLRNEFLAFLKSSSALDQHMLRGNPAVQHALIADTAAAWIKRFVFRGKSAEGVRIANELRKQRPQVLTTQPESMLGWIEFDLYYAQAIMYASHNLEECVTLLNEVIAQPWADPRFSAAHSYWRTNLVRGRAHNNLGYVYWIPQGHLGAALIQLALARNYFEAANLREELANTLDNMGRVYAIMRHETRADALVEDALEIRRQERRLYRIALSMNSRALVHLEFGRPHRSESLVREAYAICERLNVKRGIGLTATTLGMTLRYLGNIDELHTFGKSQAYFGDSIRELRNAISIFEDRVDEPVRLVEAMNQLGSTYRDWARLALKQPHPEPQEQTLHLAVRAFNDSIEAAHKNGFWALYADSCEDLADTYKLSGQYELANEWLNRGDAIIPPEYKLAKGADSGAPQQKRESIALNARVELYWLMLGKIELTRGEIEKTGRPANGDGAARGEWLRKMAEHYILAAYYFECFSEQTRRLKDTYRRMYESFKGCSSEERLMIRYEMLPAIAAEYKIDISRLERFYDDTFAFVLA